MVYYSYFLWTLQSTRRLRYQHTQLHACLSVLHRLSSLHPRMLLSLDDCFFCISIQVLSKLRKEWGNEMKKTGRLTLGRSGMTAGFYIRMTRESHLLCH